MIRKSPNLTQNDLDYFDRLLTFDCIDVISGWLIVVPVAGTWLFWPLGALREDPLFILESLDYQA